MTRPTAVYKFGGSSLADNFSFSAVAEIVADSDIDNLAIVVSASAGVTDNLLELVMAAAKHDNGADEALRQVASRQIELVHDLLGDSGAELADRIGRDIEDVNDVLKATRLMGHATDNALSVVASYGELWSAQLLAAYLTQQGSPTTWLDSREVLVAEPSSPTPLIDMKISRNNVADSILADGPGVVVITGFLASDHAGAPITLGRNGSDLSASVFGALLNADEVVVWTDVDGVYSADPSLVPAAHVLETLTYDEAMELAYFGANVIHPATMGPAVSQAIPIYIRNTFNTSSPGTRIGLETKVDTPVKGFASIGEMALVNLEGTGMIGVPGVSERLFGALRADGISVVLISQASSEHSICFAVPEKEAAAAAKATQREFDLEIDHGLLHNREVTPNCTILAAVGDSMTGTPGIAARLFGSLARAGINVRAIAQGASERNISVVIDSDDATRAMRAVHSGFYMSPKTLSVGLIGPGHVGSTLLDQISHRHEWLTEHFDVDIRLTALASSSKMLLDEDGIQLKEWRDRFSQDQLEKTDLDLFARHVRSDAVPHAVIIDCTANDDIAMRYSNWLSDRIHVITPNKKANSGSFSYYQTLQRDARRSNTHYLYETTVGAALPVVQTLRDLVQTGDTVKRIEGVFSGTLSYLFNQFDGSMPFSEIVSAAREMGYTEPDPREDLSGTDVARKVVILAREMGMDIELEDLTLESLVPEGLEGTSTQDFLAELREFDGEMLAMVEDARARGKVLRFVGVIDPGEGCDVSLREYNADHPFAAIRATDNIVRFETARYHDNPLVIQGPGAGPQVTAGGVFSDLLRLANYLGATF